MKGDGLVEGLRRHPGMLGVAPNDYSALVTYVMGCDASTDGGLLCGFQELIELKFGQTSSLHWASLALRLKWPDEDCEVPESAKVTWLLDLLDEFFVVDASKWGIRRLFSEWCDMAKQEPWHMPELLRFGRSPAPEHVSLDEAARRLGVPTVEVLALVRANTLRAGRLGGEVRVTVQSLTSHEADAQG